MKRIKSFTTPRSLYQAFSHELRGILSGRSDDDYMSRYLLDVFESKLLDPEYSLTPEERREAAINKWLLTEERNRDTSIRLYSADHDDLLFGDVTIGRFIEWVRSLIADTIGSSVDWESLTGSFSNGASTSIQRGVGTVPRKYLHGADSTEAAIAVFNRLNLGSVHWTPEPTVVPGNVLFTVPKSTTIDRCACKEPDINMYCQKAVGDYLRHCLRRRGVNLNDQRINQELAYIGSLTGELATVDLSSASDSVTTQLVIELLPFEWVSLMMDLRSPFTEIDGHLHENFMVSSMGNAFTFELESLIFWALTRGVCYFTRTRGRVSVYGDDIICPVGAYDTLEVVLEFFGFQFNADKSFASGGFRESCGKHYYYGRDVTPFYVRKVPVDASDWIHVLNSLRSWLDRQSICGILDEDFYDIWTKYSRYIPTPVKGGWDYARRDVLVSSGKRPIARLARKQARDKRREDLYQTGSYYQWLDTAGRRKQGVETDTVGLQYGFELGSNHGFSEPLVTSEFSVARGDLQLRRFASTVWSRPIAVFVQEILD